MGKKRSSKPDRVDIAIVGGGVAGAYAAYRLAGPDARESSVIGRLREGSGADAPDIHLFEAGDRFGGRLWSKSFGSDSTLNVEFGGQAFPQLHQNVYGLCTEELGLSVQPSRVFNGGPQFWYLRRHHVPMADLAGKGARRGNGKGMQVPYFLRKKEEGKGPFGLVEEALRRGVPPYAEIKAHVDSVLKKQLAKARKAGENGAQDFVFDADDLGRILSTITAAKLALHSAWVSDGISRQRRSIFEHGFWNLLQHQLSTEAYSFITSSWATASDFQAYNLYHSCAAQLTSAFMSPFWELEDGYQSLPSALIRRFRERGGRTRTDSRLIQIDRLPKNRKGALLTFWRPSDGSAFRIRARYVILALPQHALERLDPTSSIFDEPRFQRDIRAVTPIPAYKLVMGYDEAWWEEEPPGDGIDPPISGFSLTDTPLRGCYYLGEDPKGLAFIYASISDSVTQGFWAGFLKEAGLGLFGRPFVPHVPEGSGLTGWKPSPELGVTEEMVAVVTKMLAAMHSRKRLPEPKVAAFCNWTRDPFGGGWHAWNPHVRPWEVMPRVQRLGVDRSESPRIFLCGEAFSSDQGWVEGALNTTETVLQDHFGLPRASWVHPIYDFGRSG